MRAAVTFLFVALAGVFAYDNGLVPTPPMGWSTWCTNDLCGIPDRCSEYGIRRKAEAMATNGMSDLGYKWILLDDCWAHTERDENGELQPSPKLFPRGMPNLIDYVHSLGLKLGLYTCLGTETCKKGRPGSYNNYEVDANTFAKWGADMVKADYCHVPGNESGRDLYTRFSKALNATGRPMLFSLCQWGEDDVAEWGGDISQMYRIQMDHIPFWSYPAQAAGVGYGQGTKQIIEFMADLHPSKYNRPHAWMDPDFLETLFEPAGHAYPPMNYTNSRTEFSFWAIWSSPLFVATDPADLSDDKKDILMNPEVIAINQDLLFSGGERIKNENTTTGGEVWSRLLANGDVCVIFYNCGNHNAVPVSINWEELQVGLTWKNSDSIAVRDLWARKDLGSFTGGYEAILDAHDVLMVRLSKPTTV